MWRRRFPFRALRRLGWLVAVGGGMAAGGWLLFGAEPDRLDSGEANLLALVPPGLTLLVGIVALPMALAVVRRPLVVADHYALRIRPGVWRTLLLPWAGIAEVACGRIRGEPLLLVRCHPALGHAGDRPRRIDQRVLRAAGRPAASYSLAVRMDEFAGTPGDQLAALAARAPHQVRFTNHL